MGAQADEPNCSVATVDWVGQARALRDMIEATSPLGEINRELASAVVEALHESGLFRLLIPRELEGGQVDLVTFVETIEALAQADGSAAWCVAQVSGCSLTSAYLPRKASCEVFGILKRADEKFVTERAYDNPKFVEDIVRDLAVRIKVEDGRPISAPYLNDLEHNLRKPPRGHLIEQFARHLDIEADVLYFAAGRVPRDIHPGSASEDQVMAAYRAFRKELKSRKR